MRFADAVLRRVFSACAAGTLLFAATAGLAADVSVAEAMARTEKAFAGKEVHGDVGFLLTQAAKRRGRDFPLRPLAVLVANRHRTPFSIEYGLWEMRSSPLPRVSFVLPAARAADFDPAQAESLLDSRQLQQRVSGQGEVVMTIMSNVMTCDGKQQPTAMIGRPGYEYVSTHQIFALLVAAQRQCQPRHVIGQLLGIYAGRVRDEFQLQLARNALTDIQIERAAMLCMIGRCDLVPKSFHQKVLKAQGADGVWRLNDPLLLNGFMPPEHPTALAYFLLAQSPL